LGGMEKVGGKLCIQGKKRGIIQIVLEGENEVCLSKNGRGGGCIDPLFRGMRAGNEMNWLFGGKVPLERGLAS